MLTTEKVFLSHPSSPPYKHLISFIWQRMKVSQRGNGSVKMSGVVALLAGKQPGNKNFDTLKCTHQNV